MADKNELIEGHEYDGIKEYDNDLPRWWLYLFYLTIIFSVIYIIGFRNGWIKSANVILAEEAEKAVTKVASQVVENADISAESLVKLASNNAVVAKGKEVFAQKCAACHMPEGQGLIGPNLTDKYWIHGGKITDIRKVIMEGVPEKGMLAWKAMMSGEDLNAVVAFIWTIRGTNPPNPKAPQGELVND